MGPYILFARRLFFFCGLLIGGMTGLPAMAAGTHAGEQTLDNIVAIVNDTVITQSELNRSVRLARSQLAADNVSPPPLTALRKQILQQLINQKLQIEAAEQSGIQVSDADLDKVIDHIAQENRISTQEFYQKIAQEGFTTKTYRKQIRESLMLQRLQQRDVASHISVTPDEIDDFLKSTSRQEAGEKEYHIQDILIAFSDNPTPTEIAIAKKFSDDITAKLRKGTALANLAAAETESLQDIDLSWRKLAEVPTAFTASVPHMKLNEYSNPIQAANGFHIIHLIGLRDLPTNSHLPKRDEVAQMIFQRKFEEAMQGWIAKIRGQAFIVIQDKAIA